MDKHTEYCECGSKLYWKTRTSKYCYNCKMEFELDEERTPCEELEREFNEALQTGTQFDVLHKANRLVVEQFSRQPEADEIENPEFEARMQEFEQKFDEWHQNRREENPISQQCLNFLKAIKTRYIRVAMIKAMTEKMNSRERQLVWSTWKGFAHTVYYPKG